MLNPITDENGTKFQITEILVCAHFTQAFHTTPNVQLLCVVEAHTCCLWEVMGSVASPWCLL